MSKTINRIIDLIDNLGISARQFDISIGASNGYTLRMKKNSASVGSDVIERIKKTYPKINLVWLITGEGEMFVEDSHEKPVSVSSQDVDQLIEQKLAEKWDVEKKLLFEEIIKEINSIKDKS